MKLIINPDSRKEKVITFDVPNEMLAEMVEVGRAKEGDFLNQLNQAAFYMVEGGTVTEGEFDELDDCPWIIKDDNGNVIGMSDSAKRLRCAKNYKNTCCRIYIGSANSL